MIGRIEYEVKCRWCPSKSFTYLPSQEFYKCDGCGKEYDLVLIINDSKMTKAV